MVSLVNRIRNKLTGRGDAALSARDRWEKRWANPDRKTRWETDQIPDVLIGARDDGFFAPGASVMDIGCGTGGIAAWLAEQSHRTVGCDFSSEAIAQADQAHQDELLSFRVSDAAVLWTDPEKFDCLFDRGCLHCLPDSALDTYAANAAASLHPGGHFLLLHRLDKSRDGDSPRGVVEKRLRSTFDAAFSVERIAEIDMIDGAIEKPVAEIPAIALWMTRHEH